MVTDTARRIDKPSSRPIRTSEKAAGAPVSASLCAPKTARPTAVAATLRAWAYARWRGLLPASCLLCGHPADGTVCTRCEQCYWQADEGVPRCERCAVRLSLQSPAAEERTGPRAALRRCGHCRARPPAFDAAFALADYRAPLDALIIALKYQGRVGLASDLARRLSARLAALPEKARPDLLVPAPLSSERLGARGYNQAWEITRRLGKCLSIRSDCDLLQRSHTDAQAGLGRYARQHNLQQAFSISAPARRSRGDADGIVTDLTGAHIGVVDDVMTTGATLDAIATQLKHHGARRVTAIVVFRTA